VSEETINRLFEITEKYECLLRAVSENPACGVILVRAEDIQRERGLIKGEGEL
jgi:uncharacterized protein (DUF1800 family)